MSISITTAFKTTISIPWGELKNVISWCQNNCESDWRFHENSYNTTNDFKYSLTYEFFFEDERDYVAFLIWKK